MFSDEFANSGDTALFRKPALPTDAYMNQNHSNVYLDGIIIN
jgi:hypothetical protein